MPRPPARRLSIPAPLLAATVGAVAGLLIFALCAALWRMGDLRAAGTASQTALLMALLGLALVGLFPRPTARMSRIRVPVSRALPPAWWPREPDVTTFLVACAGAPVVAGAAAAFLIFR